MKYFLFILAGLVLLGCQPPATETKDISLENWQAVQDAARGTEVTFMMWQGDPEINAYMNEYVIPSVRDLYGIDLKISGGQGDMIVSVLLTEMEAGKDQSEIDMCWINGETFFQLRQINALYGPFVDKLPNAEYLDLNNPFIKYDFQEETKGMEAPWGSVQQTIIYNAERVAEPPQSLVELEDWVKANPGRFTFANEFTGFSLLKAWLVELGGQPDVLDGPFKEELYQQLSSSLWERLNRMKQYFWKKGETFPATIAQVHQMYAAGELDFTSSMNDSEVDNKVLRGLFPESSRSYV
ncbi:MAG: ABC transporter substrate-binding protein, partial [Bacteroidota bacterium]